MVAEVLCGPILMTTLWADENTCISFMVIFSAQGSICIAPFFMENILYSIVQRVLRSAVKNDNDDDLTLLVLYQEGCRDVWNRFCFIQVRFLKKNSDSVRNEFGSVQL